MNERRKGALRKGASERFSAAVRPASRRVPRLVVGGSWSILAEVVDDNASLVVRPVFARRAEPARVDGPAAGR
jgi:hypothetical protein